MKPFRYFVVLAGMRTGSNFLEANLNLFDDLNCLGELFNPTFVGHHNKTSAFGFDLRTREERPIDLLEKMIEQAEGLPGFRLFLDHDQRVLSHCLSDQSCAKVVLTRDDVDSYVSLKIASKTKQWRLSDAKQRRSAVIRFDEAEFERFVAERRAFRLSILGTLKRAGQTAFEIDYEELRDVEILNGLAQYLGATGRVKNVSSALKRQNPGALKDKVSNFAEMTRHLSTRQHATSDISTSEEQERGALVKSYVASNQAPLLFMPLPGGPVQSVLRWMADLENIEPGDLADGFSQSSLWAWRKENAPHRSFTVLRHPLSRAHHAYCSWLQPRSDEKFLETRKIIRNRYGVPLPKLDALGAYSLDDHKAGFEGFLKFLKANLAGQTSLGTDSNWASQTAFLAGISRVNSPDLVVREEELAPFLEYLAEFAGLANHSIGPEPVSVPFELAQIEDGYIRKRAFDVYRKDYINFGYEKPE